MSTSTKKTESKYIIQEALRLRNADDLIAIKPACMVFGLDYSRQLRSIKSDFLLKKLITQASFYAADTRVRKMSALPPHAFLRWIYRININSIKKENRQAFEEFVETIHLRLFKVKTL